MLPLCYLTAFDPVGVLLNSLSLFVVLLSATFLQEE